MTEPRTITIGGKRYRFAWKDCGIGYHGHCDAPTVRDKDIRLHPSLKRNNRKMLAKLIHELLHGADWSKDEEWVDATAEDLARILWQFGFRRIDN